MFDLQARALLECEYRYYQVSSPYIFEGHELVLGYKRFPPVEKLTNDELRQLNERIRKVLHFMVMRRASA